MPPELSVQERLLFDQIIGEFDRPTNAANPLLRFLAGVVIAIAGCALALVAIKVTVLAFVSCLIVAAGGSLAVHARIRLGAFPNVQFPDFKPQQRSRQPFRPSPGRPGPL